MNVLASFVRLIDGFNDRLGRLVSWVALVMVAAQFLVVVMRYVFGIGSILLQESVIYMHAVLFMLGAGYTLLHGGHVRVDILYSRAGPRRKALVDFLGSLVLLIPVCVLIWWASWPYVENSWAVLEGSKETSGIEAVFLLKSVILAFAALLLLQGLSMMARAVLVMAGAEVPGKDE